MTVSYCIHWFAISTNSFEAPFIGITGNPENIFALSKSWGVLSEKIFNEDGTYLINHSSSILLLRKGKYIDRISHHETEDNILKISTLYSKLILSLNK